MHTPQFLLIIFWVIYYILHSVFAHNSVKKAFYKTFKMSSKVYRLVYVLFSVVGLMYILYFTATQKHHYFWSGSLTKFFGLMLTTYGLFIIREAFKNYHAKAFFGLASPEEESKILVTDGMQKHIRHPLYAGTLLLMMGFFLFMPTQENLITVVMSAIYIFIGIYLEEKKLTETFGNEYEKYKDKTPMLIPKFRK